MAATADLSSLVPKIADPAREDATMIGDTSNSPLRVMPAAPGRRRGYRYRSGDRHSKTFGATSIGIV
jgi:hypothetical protein